MKTTQDILRERRLELRMSQEQLAGAAGVTRKTVTRAEAGSRISTETLKALCAVLDLDSASLETDAGTGSMDDGPSGVEEMIGKADLPADARDLVLRAAACIAEVAPNARAVAVTDADIWRRVRYKQLLDVDDPGNPNLAKDAGRKRLYGAAAISMLIACLGQPIFVLVTIVMARAGVPGGAALLDWYFGLFPSPFGQPLTAAIAMWVFLGVPVLGGAFGFATYSGMARDLGITERINRRYAKVIEESTEGFRGRVYVAGPDGLHILDVRADGAVDAVHVEPWMVASCQIEGGSFRPTLRMHQSPGRHYRDDEPQEIWVPRLYRPDVEQFRLPYLIPGEAFIEAMSSFRPVPMKHPKETVTHRPAAGPESVPVAA